MNDTTAEAQQPGFFVYIVESPGPVDLYHRRGEGDLLRQAVSLNRIRCVTRLAINLDAFVAALGVGLSEALEAMPDAVPILHISAHGYPDGIQLSTGQTLEWHELRELLIPINRALGGNLLVCMSTCEGYSGQRMAMVRENGAHPFLAIVGNCSKPTWAQTAVGFATFYHLLAGDTSIPDAVNAMRVASGNNDFFATTAEQSRQSFLSYIAELEAGDVKEELDEQLESSDSSELVKMLRRSPNAPA